MIAVRSKPVKYCLATLFALLVLAGLTIGAFQIAVTRVPEYRVQLQNWVSDKTGLAIEFSKLGARLRLYGPELVFNDAVVSTPDRSRVLATARRGSVGFDLWNSIRAGRLTAGRFTLDSPQIALIRTREGRIQLVGQSALPERDIRPIAVESLPIGQFRVRNAVVSFRDEATGRGPWSLSGVSFRLDRQDASLELRGDASLPHSLGKSLEFSAHVSGPLQNVEALASGFAIEGRDLDLAGWADVLPDEWMVAETGHGSIRMAGALAGRRLTELSAKLDLAAVTAVAPVWMTPLPTAMPLVMKTDDAPSKDDAAQDPPAADDDPAAPAASPQPPQLLSYDRIALDLRATRQGEGWELSASDVDLTRKSSPWRAGKIVVKWTQSPAGGLSLAASADRLVLQNLWPLLAYLPESQGLAYVRALQATGTIENLSLDMQRASSQEPVTYSLQAEVHAAGFQPVLRTPGFSGISAHIKGTQASGAVQLDSQDVQFDLPRMFRAPLHAQSIRGAIGWQRTQQGMQLFSKELDVASEDGAAVANLVLTIPSDGSSPVIDLSARARDMNAAATSKYLPADKFTPKSLEWLDRAFVSGRVTEGHVILKGPVRSFPFRHGEGEFLARGRVEDMTFDYEQGWERATALAVNVEFRNQGMSASGATGNVGGLSITDARGEFRDFKTGELSVDAQAAGDLGHALKFLQDSPISAALGEQFQKLSGQGATTSKVQLRLPLKHIADRRITVQTQLKNVTVAAEGVSAPVTALSGSLTVRQSLPQLASLHGQWLGGPLDVVIRPAAATDGGGLAASLTANGRADAERLAPLLHLPSSAKISGATDWQMTTRLETSPEPGPSQQARKYVVDSNLEGLGIELPYPLGKPQTESRPLRVELEYDGVSSLLTRAAFGDVRALVRMRQTDDRWEFDRGGVRADAIAAALPGHRGLRIEGSLDRLELDDWFALKGQGTGNGRLGDFLDAANLRVGTLQLYGYQFADVRGVLQAMGSGWRVDVAGPNAEGELTIPDDLTGSQPLTATLDRLVVTREGRESGKSAGQDPHSWPNLRVSIADLRVDNHAVGAVALQASRVAEGLKIDTFTVTQDAVRAEARGHWFKTDEGERSALNATVVSTDVAATLRALSYSPVMEAEHGEISAELSWPGGFDSDFLGRASGTVKVAAERGQLLNLQPGAGRVLGLFSVAALPRRLALDFSDLIDKGLSFDAIHGDFQMRDGNAFTNNLLLRGPAAEIGIAGRTGLGARDYDQTAVVTGNLGVSLPVAGALAGGPAVGAALLLFSQVFKEPLKGIARGYYRITGPWDDPVVERVDAAEIKEAAANTKSAP